MTEPNLVGGSAEDRAEILKLHEAYIDVNTRFDWENLQPLFSPSPEATFFNLNGHTYRGREHWTRLWKFYVQQVQSSYWTPYRHRRRRHRRSRRGVVPPQDAAAMDRQGAAAARHPLRQQRSSSRARPWCSARKTARGGSCTRISRRPIGVRGPAACEARALPPFPKLSVRLHGGHVAATMRRPGEGRGGRGLCRRVVRREPVRARHPAGGFGLRGGDATPRHRRRRVQSVQPPSHADRHGDRRARRTRGWARVRLGIGSGIGSAVERMGHELCAPAHRARRGDRHRARAARAARR